jgi:SPP1 family predicted phage head-tail adaptor
MTFPARKRRSLITVQQRDAGLMDGEPSQTWTDVATVWANIAGDTGLHTIRTAGDTPISTKSYSFRIRYREGLDESMRVVYAGQHFAIRQVRMDFAGKQWTDLVCELGRTDA